MRQHKQEEGAIEFKYYDYFDSKTADGKVFKINGSTNEDDTADHLTELEIKERRAYSNTVIDLIAHYEYDEASNPVCTT
jgi:hypothetical protein